MRIHLREGLWRRGPTGFSRAVPMLVASLVAWFLVLPDPRIIIPSWDGVSWVGGERPDNSASFRVTVTVVDRLVREDGTQREMISPPVAVANNAEVPAGHGEVIVQMVFGPGVSREDVINRLQLQPPPTDMVWEAAGGGELLRLRWPPVAGNGPQEIEVIQRSRSPVADNRKLNRDFGFRIIRNERPTYTITGDGIPGVGVPYQRPRLAYDLPTGEYAFTFSFNQAMSRRSVEPALRTNLGCRAALDLAWRDESLTVIVRPEDVQVEPCFLDPRGARSESGMTLWFGESLELHFHRTRELVAVTLPGGGGRRLAELPPGLVHGSLAPGGRRLVMFEPVLSREQESDRVPAPSIPWVLNVSTGTADELYGVLGLTDAVAWFPDGHRLVGGGENSLATYDTATGEASMAIRPSAGRVFFGSTLAPLGGKLAFWERPADPTTGEEVALNLIIHDLDSNGEEWWPAVVKLRWDDDLTRRGVIPLTWTADGRRLAFLEPAGDQRLRLALFSPETGGRIYPGVSPRDWDAVGPADGKYLSVRERDGWAVVSSSGVVAARISADNGLPNAPLISPDGRWAAFLAPDGDRTLVFDIPDRRWMSSLEGEPVAWHGRELYLARLK